MCSSVSINILQALSETELDTCWEQCLHLNVPLRQQREGQAAGPAAPGSVVLLLCLLGISNAASLWSKILPRFGKWFFSKLLLSHSTCVFSPAGCFWVIYAKQNCLVIILLTSCVTTVKPTFSGTSL